MLMGAGGSNPAGGTTIAVRPGSRLAVDVDRSRTSFLRSELAVRYVHNQDDLALRAFRAALNDAAACDKKSFTDAATVSGTLAEPFNRWGLSKSLTYGDHAAMLLLRDAFVTRMQAESARIEWTLQTHARGDDRFVDAWFESDASVVTYHTVRLPDRPRHSRRDCFSG